MRLPSRFSFAAVGLLCLAAVGCTMDAWLWPFGNYYYYKNGVPADLTDLIGGTTGTTSTTGTTDTTGTTGGTVDDLLGGLGGLTGDTTTDTTDTANFSDDFSDGNLDGWSILSGNWVVTEGGYAEATGPAVGDYYIMVVGEDTWTDYEVNLDVRLDAGAEYAVGVRYVNDQTWYHCSHSVAGLGSIWVFATGQGDKLLANGTSIPLPQGEWYHWRIIVQGNTITFDVEGGNVARISDDDSLITAGRVALLVAPGAIASFDNVVITPVSN